MVVDGEDRRSKLRRRLAAGIVAVIATAPVGSTAAPLPMLEPPPCIQSGDCVDWLHDKACKTIDDIAECPEPQSDDPGH